MTLENTNLGSEYGIESRTLGLHDWQLVGISGKGYETYEEAYQYVLEMAGEICKIGLNDVEFRVVVYDYNGAVRKNIRILTIIKARDLLC